MVKIKYNFDDLVDDASSLRDLERFADTNNGERMILLIGILHFKENKPSCEARDFIEKLRMEKSTVYRNLLKLCSMGIFKKIRIPRGNSTRFNPDRYVISDEGLLDYIIEKKQKEKGWKK